MVCKLINILISQLLAIHFLDTVSKQTTVQTNKVRLRQLADERSNVLMLHVGIGIILRACGRVGSIAVVGEELQLAQGLTVFAVLLAIEHERLGHLVEAFAHESLLHLVLNVLHLYVVTYIKMAYNLGYRTKVHWLRHTLKGFENGIHYFV